MTSSGPISVGVVRFDDAIAGHGWQFDGLIATHIATRLDQVGAVLLAAEQAAQQGHWAAGYVSYEAGAAFDRAFPIRREGIEPLVCFVEYEHRHRVPLVTPTAPPAPAVTRVGGSEWYREGVETIRQAIARGDVYQVNLTDRFVGTAASAPFELYRAMVANQSAAYNAYLEIGDNTIISASPELFFRLDGQRVTTKPMKGTAARRARPGDDIAAGLALRRSLKDRAENVMIVDLLRNDLSRVARIGSVEVPALFDLERYETVWQLTSTVSAELRPGIALVDVFSALFPCGSVTGAPKVAAMRMIDQIETQPRGIYCGAIGWVGPQPDGDCSIQAQFSVAIRTAAIDTDSRRLTYGTGGGITWDSDPHAEDDEAVAKAAVLRATRAAFDLYTTALIDADGMRHRDLHLDRLASSAAYFGFPFDRDRALQLIAAVDGSQIAQRVRLLLGRSGEMRLEQRDIEQVPSEVRLAVAELRVGNDDPFLCHKTTRRETHERARAEHPEVDDTLIVNTADEVVETTVANVLYRRGDRWFTPPLASGCLDGVGRRALLDAGEIGERVLLLSELASCDELQVVSSLRGRRRAIIDAAG